MDVEITEEEARTRADRREAFAAHLRETRAEKELVVAFATMYRLNARPKDPLEWLLEYFERDQRAHVRMAERKAEEYAAELRRVE